MKKLYFIALLLIVTGNSFSQFNYTVANTSIIGGTYTDLGTNGTAITTNALGTAITYDDDVSSLQSIGFTFQYNGQSFTQFSLHTNGFIKLGIDTPAAATIDPLASAAPNLIYPYGYDLDGDASSSYRVYTEGTAGSRICTIQYKNVRDYPQTGQTVSQYTGINFQIKLYEANSNIEFVYGTFNPSTAAPIFVPVSAGVKGSDAGNSVNGTKSSLTDWLSALFISGAYTGNKFNNRNTVLPPLGTTIRFISTPPPNADASVLLYTLGKLPIGFGTPHIIKAVVKNNGVTALNGRTVSLSITGANTFTNSKTIDLPVGSTDTVSFDAFTPTNVGGNTIVVTIPADDVNTNNSSSYYQLVTTNEMSYADTSSKRGQIGYNTNSGLLLCKYKVNGSAQVGAVKVFLGGGSSIIGNKVYAVVVNSAGMIVAKSDSLPIVPTDTNTVKTYLISAPPAFSNEEFYVGLAQTATAFTGYFPLGYQAELPIKANQYYTAPIAGGVVPTQNNSIGRFMIDAVLATTVPLNLLSFTGKLNNENVVLNWKTANEVNTKNFEIQRSINGETFENVGVVDAVSNRSTINNYSFNDLNVKKLSSKILYYRLNQVDKDGRSKLSNVIRVNVVKDNNNIISGIYPNPATKQISLTLNSLVSEKISLVINDFAGKSVFQKAYEVIEGVNNLTINVEGLVAGTYIIKAICSSGCETASAKFIKK